MYGNAYKPEKTSLQTASTNSAEHARHQNKIRPRMVTNFECAVIGLSPDRVTQALPKRISYIMPSIIIKPQIKSVPKEHTDACSPW